MVHTIIVLVAKSKIVVSSTLVHEVRPIACVLLIILFAIFAVKQLPMNYHPKNIISFFTFILLLQQAFAQNPLGIIPAPASEKVNTGNFVLSDKTIIEWKNAIDSVSAQLFSDDIKKYYNVAIVQNKTNAAENKITLERSASGSLPSEGYTLEISPNQIIIRGDSAGIFYGLKTVEQLIPAKASASIQIPCCSITDYPRYAWRGMMLDVCRHFFTKQDVEQVLDYLAAYKLNTFHWHLTDDQGWRIEIKRYPKLTQVGAWRNGTLIGHYSDHPQFDTIRYGGYYTQDDIREVVAYAKKRFITVVPEIEMPGHSTAALAAYPELACSGNNFQVERSWGVFTDILCPTEETFAFMDSVLSEVMNLFPSKYIHIGGDECPKDRWKQSDYCQQLIKKLGLKDEDQLQGYFTKRISEFVNSRGRSIIGWDEILDGGVAPNDAIMSWRGTEGGIKAAQMKHHVVMSPGATCYFDHYQSSNADEPLAFGGYLPIETVYGYDPTPEQLSADEKKYIMGVQANLWTEYVPTFKQAQYMTLPRLCALAEVAWTPKDKKNFQTFIESVTEKQFPRFDLWQANYATVARDVNFKLQSNKSSNGIAVHFSDYDTTMKIRYALLDTSEKNKNDITWLPYSQPVAVPNSCVLKAQASNDEGFKSRTLTQSLFVNDATGHPITLVNRPDTEYSIGGNFTLVNGIWGRLPWMGSEWLGFNGTDLIATVDLKEKKNISEVTLGVLDDNGSWIYLPEAVEVFVSNDNKNFQSAGKVILADIKNTGGRKAIIQMKNTSARYVKIVAMNYGVIPAGSEGAGNKAWLFADEISIR